MPWLFSARLEEQNFKKPSLQQNKRVEPRVELTLIVALVMSAKTHKEKHTQTNLLYYFPVGM